MEKTKKGKKIMGFFNNTYNLIKELKKNNFTHLKILEAIKNIKREEFVPSDLKPFAYKNAPLAIGYQQTISQPFMVATMTHLLKITPHVKVLEIGTGSGYQAAILDYLNAQVFTLERIEALYQKAQQKLLEVAPKVKCYLQDGNLGLPQEAPFQRILGTAAFEEWPHVLESQLCQKEGILLFPLGKEWEVQQLVKLSYRQGERKVVYLDYCRFVPMKKNLILK